MPPLPQRIFEALKMPGKEGERERERKKERKRERQRERERDLGKRNLFRNLPKEPYENVEDP
jgi:hypothetical protein